MATKYLGAQPTGGFYIWKNDKVTPYPMKDMKLAILVGVPGAYTPVCTDEHLKGYVDEINDGAFQEVDIIFFSTNDVMVMDAWNKAHGSPKIIAVSDDKYGPLSADVSDDAGSGDAPANPVFKALNQTVEFGETFGERVNRCAYLVENGEVTHKFDDPFANKVKIEAEEIFSSPL